MKITDVQSPYVFISYAHKNASTVHPILKAMEEAGFRLWYDAGIEAGTEWPANIEAHLRAAEAFVVFMSRDTVESKNCRNEINLALSCGKEILVAYIEDTELRHGLGLQLGTTQSIFLERHKSIDSFVRELKKTAFLKPCLRGEPPVEKEEAVTVAEEPSHSLAAHPFRDKVRVPSPVKNAQPSYSEPLQGHIPRGVRVGECFSRPVVLVGLGGVGCNTVMRALPTLHAQPGNELSAFLVDVDPGELDSLRQEADRLSDGGSKSPHVEVISLAHTESIGDILVGLEGIDEEERKRYMGSDSPTVSCNRRREAYLTVANADRNKKFEQMADRLLRMSKNRGVEVFLVTSLGGNFGSGALLPVAQMIKKKLASASSSLFLTTFLATPEVINTDHLPDSTVKLMRARAYATMKELCGICVLPPYSAPLSRTLGKLRFFEEHRSVETARMLYPSAVDRVVIAPTLPPFKSSFGQLHATADALSMSVLDGGHISRWDNIRILAAQSGGSPRFSVSSVAAATVVYPRSLLDAIDRRSAFTLIEEKGWCYSLLQFYRDIFGASDRQEGEEVYSARRERLHTLLTSKDPYVRQALAPFYPQKEDDVLPQDIVAEITGVLRDRSAEAMSGFFARKDVTAYRQEAEGECRAVLKNKSVLFRSQAVRREQSGAFDRLIQKTDGALVKTARRYLEEETGLMLGLEEACLHAAEQILDPGREGLGIEYRHPVIAYLLLLLAKKEMEEIVASTEPLILEEKTYLPEAYYRLPQGDPKERKYKKSAYLKSGVDRFYRYLTGASFGGGSDTDPYYDILAALDDTDSLYRGIEEHLTLQLCCSLAQRVLAHLTRLIEGYEEAFCIYEEAVERVKQSLPQLPEHAVSVITDEELSLYEDRFFLTFADGLRFDDYASGCHEKAFKLFSRKARGEIGKEKFATEMIDAATEEFRRICKSPLPEAKGIVEYLYKKLGDGMPQEIQALVRRATPAQYRDKAYFFFLSRKDALDIQKWRAELGIKSLSTGGMEETLVLFAERCKLERVTFVETEAPLCGDPSFGFLFSADEERPENLLLCKEGRDGPYYSAYRQVMRDQRMNEVDRGLHLHPDLGKPSVLPAISPRWRDRYLDKAALAFLLKIIKGDMTVQRVDKRLGLTRDTVNGLPLSVGANTDSFTEDRMMALFDDVDTVEALCDGAKNERDALVKDLPVTVSAEDVSTLIDALLRLPTSRALCEDLQCGRGEPINLALLAYSAQYSKAECFKREFTAENLLLSGLVYFYRLIVSALSQEFAVHYDLIYGVFVDTMLKSVKEDDRLSAAEKSRIADFVEKLAFAEE